MLATAPNSPAKIEAMTMLKEPLGDSWVTAKPLRFTSQQLAQINRVSVGINPLPAVLDPVPLGEAVSDITFAGNAAGVVTINRITIAKQCSAPLSGTLFSSPAQGFNNTIRIEFDLDDLNPVARYLPGGGVSASTSFFPGHVVTLAPGETQTFAFDHYCNFTFRLSVVTPKGPVTEIINDSGKPFAITGLAQRSYGAAYAGGTAALNDHLNKNGYRAPENPATPQH